MAKLTDVEVKAAHLTAEKVLTDYRCALRRMNPEPESFFETWMRQFMPSHKQEFTSEVWKKFMNDLSRGAHRG